MTIMNAEKSTTIELSTQDHEKKREDQQSFDEALARAFAKIDFAAKDGKNPHFRSSYATLASVYDACREALTSEGFSFPQTLNLIHTEEGLSIVVTTRLRRKGVELISSLPMPVGGKGTPQDIGSAITYGRRYSLSALVGVCPDDDDDGNAASAPVVRGANSKPSVSRFIDSQPSSEPEPYYIEELRTKFTEASSKKGVTFDQVLKEANVNLRVDPHTGKRATPTGSEAAKILQVLHKTLQES